MPRSGKARADRTPPAPETDYDVLIAGGGMVGASLALALGGRGLRLGVVEPQPFDAAIQPSYDDRAIALGYGSRRILEAIGVWPRLAGVAEPILRIHVSNRGHFGLTRLDHGEEAVDALGYVVTGRELGAALLPALDEAEGVRLLCPARIRGLRVGPDWVDLDDGAGPLRTRLLVAADGGRSQIRELLGIAVREWTYGHHALIANLTPERSHGGTAFERFTDTGPLAMLPMSEGRCALVWTLGDQDVESVMALDDATFLAQVQERFGYRLGRLRQVGRRSAYPLRQVYAREQVRPRVALIGNAAHTVHPVAGQGFNLGIRDVAALAEVIAGALVRGEDIGDLGVLDRYTAWRRSDHRRVLLATDVLARLFINPLRSVAVLRNLGMLGIDLIPAAKHLLARQAMGLSGRLPRLARGIGLD